MKSNRLRYYRHSLQACQWALVNLRECRRMGGYAPYAAYRNSHLSSAMAWRKMIEREEARQELERLRNV